MKSLTKSAIIALAAASIGAASLSPALAQQQGGDHRPFGQHQMGEGMRHGGPGPMGGQFRGPGAMGGGLVQMLLSDRGADILDEVVDNLTTELELDEGQQSLLADLRAAVENAAADLDAARESIEPMAEDDAENPDIVARFGGMVAMTTARADALESIQPAFEAFIGSLDEDQMTALAELRPGPDGHHGPKNGPKNADASDAEDDSEAAEG